MSPLDDPETTDTDGGGGGWLPHWIPRRRLIHLVYLINLGWQPFFDPSATWVDWAVVVVVVLLFVPLYVLCFHPRLDLSRTVLIATVVLGTVATVVNVSASVLFVYAAVHASYLYGQRAVRWHLAFSGILVVIAAVGPVDLPYRVYAMIPAFAFMWIIGQQAIEDAARDRDAERLRIDNVRVQHLATGAERERIARDLHDLLGQSLTGLVVRAQLVQSLVHHDQAAAAHAAQELEETARAALEQVRTAVGGLREISLADEIDAARQTLAAAGLAVSVDIPPDAAPNPLVERSLALALREAVTNVVRHAHADDCRIVLTRQADTWRLEVADDGVGSTLSEGNGLRGMRERIAAIGGAVDRQVERGTTVVVTVPA